MGSGIKPRSIRHLALFAGLCLFATHAGAREKPGDKAPPLPKTGRNKPGALVYRSGEGSMGSLTGVAQWQLKRRSGRLVTLLRETDRLREQMLVRDTDLDIPGPGAAAPVQAIATTPIYVSDSEPPSPFDPPAPPPAPPLAKVDGEVVESPRELVKASIAPDACVKTGVCRVALRAQKRLDFGDGNFIEATGRLEFARALKVCHVGPVLRLEPDGVNDGWLSPAIFSFDTEGRPLLFHQRLLEVGESVGEMKTAQPPPCNTGKAGWQKAAAVGEADLPRMGQFILSDEDAKVVSRAMAIDSQRAFELAKKLAVNAFIYSDRWCDDAVRQIVFLADDGEKNVSRPLEELIAQYWDDVVLRHALMYMEYAPADCKRALRRMHQSKRIAAEQKLVHLHFGY